MEGSPPPVRAQGNVQETAFSGDGTPGRPEFSGDIRRGRRQLRRIRIQRTDAESRAGALNRGAGPVVGIGGFSVA
jgi:hypothetical protein